MPDRDAIAVLKEDHATVKDLLKQLESSTSRAARSRQKLIEKIDKEVTIHSQIEEEIFYPAFREAVEKKDDEQLFFEAREEHHVVDLVLPEARQLDPASPEFEAKGTVLKELIEHHIREEEKEMFPKARKVMSREELVDLGRRLEERKRALKK